MYNNNIYSLILDHFSILYTFNYESHAYQINVYYMPLFTNVS